MILAQITDTHLLLPDEPEPEDKDAAEIRISALKRVVADINALNPRPDAVIHTGDITHTGSPQQFALARQLLGELEVPYYPAAGNRDGRDEFIKAFSVDGHLDDRARFAIYAVDTHAVRLIAVDSLCIGTNTGDFCPDRLSELDASLAKEPTRPTVIFLHHPPFEVVESKFPWAYKRPEAYTEIAELIQRHPQVRRIFAGHAHRAASAEVGGVPVSTMPSVAIDLRMGTYPDEVLGDPIYQLHRFTDGEFETESRLVGA